MFTHTKLICLPSIYLYLCVHQLDHIHSIILSSETRKNNTPIGRSTFSTQILDFNIIIQLRRKGEKVERKRNITR